MAKHKDAPAHMEPVLQVDEKAGAVRLANVDPVLGTPIPDNEKAPLNPDGTPKERIGT